VTPVELQPLQASGEAVAAAELVERLGLRDRPVEDGARPRVAAAMVASADGRAAVDGRSGPLGNPADRALFRGLRFGVDALLVGTGTLRAERYAKVLDPEQIALRSADGRPRKPMVATIARALDVPADIGIFAEPDQRVAVYTEAEGEAPSHGAVVTTHRLEPASPRAVLEHLAAEHRVRAVLCEGGPSLLRAVVADGCLDDLFLTVAPLLVGGDEPLTVAGEALRPPAALRLEGTWRAGDHLFLHYSRP
jgi:riboflavin biosynthesis pyrimidine reductase